MKTQEIVLVSLLALIAVPLISRSQQNPRQSEAQHTATGTIRGIVVREGTDEPLSDVEIATMNQTESAAVDTSDTSTLADITPALLGGSTLTSDALVQILNNGYENGDRPLGITDTSRADDRGEYRIFWAPHGDYVVGASLPHFSGGENFTFRDRVIISSITHLEPS